MPQTQIACPQCRKTIAAQVEQLFDITSDPGSKQRLLGGQVNRARCPFCGYQGNLATPIVYHDNEKELLLTHFPGELGLPVNEQEKLIGPLITQVMNKLPAEKRKAYLLRPQTFLTYQSLVERVLEADGISKEMLDAQQKRVNVIQSLMQVTSPGARSEIIKQNQPILDETFFALFGRIFESAIQSGQQAAAQAMTALQAQLMAETDYGKKMQGQMAEVEAAVKSLQEVGQGLTREKLLEIFLEAPSDARLQALVSMTRRGLDYEFFTLLTGRMEQSSGGQKEKLESLRSKLMDYVSQIDQRLEEDLKNAKTFVEELLKQPDVGKAAQENLDQFTEPVMQILQALIREAQQKNDAAQMEKLQQVAAVLQQASAPPELAVLEQLLALDERDYDKVLAENEGLLTEQFMGLLGGLIGQMDAQPKDQMPPEDAETFRKVEALYRAALRLSMKKNLT